jgi:hypothetical protein
MSLKQRAYASELDWAAKPECRLRLTFDKSPVRERRTPGPVRGARGNSRLYRDHFWTQRMVKSRERQHLFIVRRSRNLRTNEWRLIPLYILC